MFFTHQACPRARPGFHAAGLCVRLKVNPIRAAELCVRFGLKLNPLRCRVKSHACPRMGLCRLGVHWVSLDFIWNPGLSAVGMSSSFLYQLVDFWSMVVWLAWWNVGAGALKIPLNMSTWWVLAECLVSNSWAQHGTEIWLVFWPQMILKIDTILRYSTIHCQVVYSSSTTVFCFEFLRGDILNDQIRRYNLFDIYRSDLNERQCSEQHYLISCGKTKSRIKMRITPQKHFFRISDNKCTK